MISPPKTRHPGRHRVAVGVLALLLLAPTGASALDWNQERVAALAREFAAAVRILASDRGLETPQSDSIQQRRMYAAVAGIRQMVTPAQDLADALSAGRGKDETIGYYMGIDKQREIVRDYARDSQLPPETRGRAARARELLVLLSAYYDDV